MNNSQEQNELKANETNNLPLQNTETAALAYATAGISVLPLKADSKKPALPEWTSKQETISDQDEIRSWFKGSDREIGIVCGKVSGQLEGLDFDEKYNVDTPSLFDRFKKLADEINPVLLNKLTIEKTQNNGYHIFYRCDVIGENQKLAMREATQDEIEEAKNKNEKAGPKTLIETRGEGGYFMCAPSKGYTLLQGSIENIPLITVEERTILLDTARCFNEVIEEHQVYDRPVSLKLSEKRPGDDFNLRGDIRDLLVKQGWKKVFTTKTSEQWRRPGKNDGVSASFNYSGFNTPNLFFVFSSNAHPFTSGKAYTMFAVYALLEHNGNWSAASAELAKLGFGSTTTSETEDFLSERYVFRYNIVSGRTEFRIKGTKNYSDIDDTQLNSFYRLLQKYHIKIGIDSLAGLLHSDFVSSYNPFLDYYYELPAWDGIDYISQLAGTIKVKTQDDNALFGTHLKKWLVNTVACAISESETNQNALILVGEQGKYKTTWLNRLVPKKLNKYKFVGTINPDNKDTLIHLSECMLINLDELETLRKSSMGALKSIMTLPHIRIRRPYGRIAENLIRRASFVGSINNSNFLNDETGTRRFLTHEIESIDLKTEIDMDKVHAQAYHLYKSNFQYWFNMEEIKRVNEHNEQFAVIATEDEILKKLYRPAKAEEIDNNTCLWKTATDVALEASSVHKYPVTKNSAREFGVTLKKAGSKSKRASNGTLYALIDLQGSTYQVSIDDINRRSDNV